MTKYDSREKVVIIYIFHIALCTVNVIAQCVKNEKKILTQKLWKLWKFTFALFLQYFMKTTFLQNKSLNSWFDEKFSVRENFSLFHNVPNYKSSQVIFGPILERWTTEMRKIRLMKRFPMIMENVKSCKWIKCLVQCQAYLLGSLLLFNKVISPF